MLQGIFLLHDAMHSTDYAVARWMSVLLVLSKQLNRSSNIFHRRVDTPF